MFKINGLSVKIIKSTYKGYYEDCEFLIKVKFIFVATTIIGLIILGTFKVIIYFAYDGAPVRKV
jgi:hypothetical protein